MDPREYSKYTETSNYINRELSLLEFNERVLMEAVDTKHPLLERLKFLTIFSSNMDEFFMIRVAGLKNQVASGVNELSYDGKTPQEQLVAIRKKIEPLYEIHTKILMEDVIPKLQENGIKICRYDEMDEDEQKFLKEYFQEKIFPILTPLSFGPTNPFPQLLNRSLNIAFILKETRKDKVEERYTFVQLPPILDRLVLLPKKKGYNFILVEEVIKANAALLFPGLEITAAYNFRVTRDADLEIAEDEAEDLLSEISEQIKHRRWGLAPVRLEVGPNFPQDLLNFMSEYLDLTLNDVYVYSRPLGLPDLMEFNKLDLPALKDKPFNPNVIKDFQGDDKRVFSAISKRDYFVHLPYDSFSNSVLKFINSASVDPDVVLIKITLYRTDKSSPVLAALIRAAENGKSVTAFVELKARFDEENNIVWSRKLESAGVHVVYGVPRLKTHCKIAYIVRKEANKFKTYLHLASGNYNQVTARLYTDVGVFTTNQRFAQDAAQLFNYLTSYSYPTKWNEFIVAPITLYNKIVDLIDKAIEKTTAENPSIIFVKMNQLAHKHVIAKLYEASQAGVQVKLLVRGVCCLKPGLSGISENIEVRSILGRFLEHSRMFYFKFGDEEEYYIASADWMTRNFHNRIELMLPIYDKNVQNHLKQILEYHWKDNKSSWRLNSDGSYTQITPREGEEPFNVQQFFIGSTFNFRKKTKK